MNVRVSRLTMVLAVASAAMIGFASVPPGIAHASPITDKQAQAAQLESAIEANGQRADALSEQMNGATLRLAQARTDERAAQEQLDAAQAQADALRHRLATRAVRLYEGAGRDDAVSMIDVKSVDQLAARSMYANAAADHDQALVDQLSAAKQDLAARKQQLESVKRQAQSDQQSLSAAQSGIASANAQQEQLLGHVKGEIATLVAQDRQRKARQAAALATRLTAARPPAVSTGHTAAVARTPEASPAPSRPGGGGGASRDGGGGRSMDPGSIPAPSAAGARAVSYAYAQLGKPYVYAAAGPDTFDCSGLVMYVYGLAGVSLPHYSGAQYDATVHIPLSQAEPGDLVFFGPGGSDHVGIYIGGGQIIHAPHTGDVVRIASIWESPSGVGRVAA